MNQQVTQRQHLLRRGIRLEYATLGWNVVASVVVILAALVSGSVALGGFGLDSLIEIFASVVVVWHLKRVAAPRERLALRLIGFAFVGLAIYLSVQSTYAIVTHAEPATSPIGIAWLAATFLAMLTLSRLKARTGAALDNEVLSSEARVTLVDAILAGSVLSGLVLHAVLGWWWADPLAAVVIVVYALKEARQLFVGEDG
jgi:divalent metal cation (Fe/Co/Zn/Cd) transporter